MSFHKDFLWGASSAATQIEGAWDEDGKCLSIWDVAENRIKNDENCHISCDHFHRYKEDVALMKTLGLNSYRFSINMCRIMPSEGEINPKGLDFYQKLIKELREANIEPIVTLYHWDLPLWAQKKGGWKNIKMIDWYLEYVRVVVNMFSDKVQYWITFNEPQMFIMAGYVTGMHAPFKHQVFSFRKCHMRNFLLAHGKAVRLIREIAKTHPKIGIAMAASTYIPDSETPDGIKDAFYKSFEGQIGSGTNSIYMDPIVFGESVGIMKGRLSEEDLKIISSPIDFIGLNVYQPSNGLINPKNYEKENHPKTMLDWVIDGRCLYWTIRQYWERYHIPVMVTENGMANPDVVDSDGKVCDDIRIKFLDEFISNMERAVDEGISVIGYQHWSIMDNFEWTEGYAPRFGLIYVDYETKKRIIKESGLHYAEIIRKKGGSL